MTWRTREIFEQEERKILAPWAAYSGDSAGRQVDEPPDELAADLDLALADNNRRDPPREGVERADELKHMRRSIFLAGLGPREAEQLAGLDRRKNHKVGKCDLLRKRGCIAGLHVKERPRIQPLTRLRYRIKGTTLVLRRGVRACCCSSCRRLSRLALLLFALQRAEPRLARRRGSVGFLTHPRHLKGSSKRVGWARVRPHRHGRPLRVRIRRARPRRGEAVAFRVEHVDLQLGGSGDDVGLALLGVGRRVRRSLQRRLEQGHIQLRRRKNSILERAQRRQEQARRSEEVSVLVRHPENKKVKCHARMCQRDQSIAWMHGEEEPMQELDRLHKHAIDS